MTLGTKTQPDDAALDEHAPPPEAPTVSWQSLQAKSHLWEPVLGFSFVFLAALAVAWVMHWMGGWADWLRWVMIATAGLMLFAFGGAAVTDIRFHIKRRDTATQTLRSASQGRIELIGTLRPLNGRLLSPLYSIPCVAHRSTFSATPPAGHAPEDAPEAVTFNERHKPAAVLLSDDAQGVFLPFVAVPEGIVGLNLSGPDAPRDLLRADIRERIPGDDWIISLRDENVVPCDMPVQVNGLYRTLSSRDSYLMAAEKQMENLEPTEEELASSPVEAAWREHCARCETAAGTGEPVPVNAILPITNFKRIAVVRVTDAGGRDTLRTMFSMLLLAIPVAYTLARLTGWMEPLPHLF